MNGSKIPHTSKDTSKEDVPPSSDQALYPYRTIGPLTHTHFTTSYWQTIIPKSSLSSLPYRTEPPYQFSYPASLTGSTALLLPIRPLGTDTKSRAVASLALPHASNTVVGELARIVAEKARPFHPDVVVGLPTGGLVIAPFVAGYLGFNRHVPFGYTRKPWFDDSLSLSISCIFTEGTPPCIYLDPNLLELVKGKRVLVVDDVISSGSIMKDTLKFLEGLEMNVVCVAVGMLQGSEWRKVLDEDTVKKIVSAIESPLLKAVKDGWVER
ncbi:hypothetical protein CJF32_00008302 [Rutstroemia sp. NJR-2017a WRK4]|nr:hypothetical protein CJF32_00008302 [Rutstroemia sp. NJR-2017a WRK4]